MEKGKEDKKEIKGMEWRRERMVESKGEKKKRLNMLSFLFFCHCYWCFFTNVFTRFKVFRKREVN